MATVTRTRADHERWSDPSESAGRLGTRAALPRGRAVLGGLLVAVAAIGILLAHQAATRRHDTRYLIAARTVHAGKAVRSADLAYAPMSLYGPTAAQAFRTPSGVVGKVARVDIASGQLVEAADVTSNRVQSGPARRLTLDLPPAQALDGSIVAGDRVDLFGTGDAAGTTALLVRHAVISAVSRPGGGLGSGDTLRVTLVVKDEQLAQSVIDAAQHGKLTLVAEAVADG